jgi:hypothetical protein
MTLYGEKQLYSNKQLHASLKVCNGSSCEGNGVVYRTSFALFLFFLIHALLVRLFVEFHWMFFIIKLLCLTGFIIGSFWIANDFYEGYAEFARVASAVFLVLQLLVLVTWAWDVSDNVLVKIEALEKNQNDENDNKCQIGWYQTILILGTFILVIACIVMWALMFVWFGAPRCKLNQALIALTIVAVVALNVVSLLISHGSVFVTGIVSLYCTYLCYSGLQSQPEANCNAFFGERNTLNLWLGIVITVAALSYAGFSVANSTVQTPKDPDDNVKESSEELEIKKENKNNEDMDELGEEERLGPSNYDDLEEGERPSKVKQDTQNEQQKPDPEKIEQKQNVVFHLCMAFASVYFAMLFTNWATDTASDSLSRRRSNVSFGVNIASEWLCFLLYLWTLLAPKIFPNRVFN